MVLVVIVDVVTAARTWLEPNERGLYLGAPVSHAWRIGRACLIKHVTRAIGTRPIAELGAADIWAIQQSMRLEGLAASTINHVTHSVLRGMLRDLEAAGLIDAEVAQRVRRARKLRLERSPKLQHYDADQRDRAIAAFAGHWAQPIVAFLFLTGCRVSEAAGLRWCDVDLVGRQVTICRGRIGKVITACKTSHSQRVIDIPDRLVAILSRLPRSGDHEELVFKGRHGKNGVDVHTLRAQVWKPILRKAGLPPLGIHGARHTVATLLLSRGIPVAQVAAHLGDTPRVVERTYAHVLPRFDVNEAMAVPPPVTQIVRERAHLRLVK